MMMMMMSSSNQHKSAAEDEADVAIYDARKEALAVGNDQILPAEVSYALLRGKSRLRALREWRKLSQSDLASAAGLGQGYLSDIESGRRKGPPETIKKIAAALAVPIDWLE